MLFPLNELGFGDFITARLFKLRYLVFSPGHDGFMFGEQSYSWELDIQW